MRIGLALAGGVARGLAHIGVLQVLEENGIEIDAYAGTSAGSIIAAAAAAGLDPYEIQHVAEHAEWWFLARPIPFGHGLMSSEGIESWLEKIMPVRSFEELQKPLTVVTVDFERGEEVVFTSGPLLRPIRASCSIPGVYQAVEYEGRKLVDGGILRNLPVTPVKDLGADFVIAVDLHRYVLDTELPKTSVGNLLRTSNILMRPQEESEAAKADVVITPHLGQMSPVAFREVSKFVELGRESAQQQITGLLERLVDIK